MVKGQLFDVHGKLLRPGEISIYVFKDGGYFDMPLPPLPPLPPVRTGRYQLRIADGPLQAIFVYATSHVDAYFRFGAV